MTGKQFLRTEVGERIDYPDFAFLAEASARDAVNQILDALVVGVDDVSDTQANTHPRFFVLAGFTPSVLGNVVNVNKDVVNGTVLQPGAAITAFRDKGVLYYGALLSGGDVTKSIDISAFPSGTYGIYVRFSLRDDTVQNRLVWNPITAPPVETARSMPTRRSENWDIAVELVSPGAEWMRIGSVIRATMTLTDERKFMFEGSPVNSYVATDDEWGSTQDRLADRSLHGAFSLYKVIRGLQRQVQDIIGETGPVGWWRSIDRSLRQLLARDGSRTVIGVLTPDVTNTRDFGTNLLRWRDMWLRTLSYYGNILGGAVGVQFLGLSGGGTANNHGSITNTPNGDTLTTNALLDIRAGDGAEGEINLAAAAVYVGTIFQVGSIIGAVANITNLTVTALLTVNPGNLTVTAGNINITTGTLNSPQINVGIHGFDTPTRTYFHSVSAAAALIPVPGPSVAFGPPLIAYGNTLPLSGYLEFDGFSNPKQAVVPIHLPNGAILTAARLTALISFVSATHFVRAAVCQVSSGGALSVLSVGPFVTILPIPFVIEHSIPISGAPVIDNNNYSYHIWIGCSLDPSSATMQLYRAEIEYTLNQLSSS